MPCAPGRQPVSREGVATRVSVKGGARSVTLDGVATWRDGRIETPGAAETPDRFEIEILGGANRVTVTAE